MVWLAEGDFCGEGLSRLSERTRAARLHAQHQNLGGAIGDTGA